ncbi:MAG: hypothetical protein AB7V11_01135 [Pyrinomonadaceae bacterium]
MLGVIAGSVMVGYFLNGFFERQRSMLGAMGLTSSAMQAQFIKMGNSALLLDSIERTLPLQIVTVSQDPQLKETLSRDTAMLAAKEFYVCTKTAIPPEIGDILQQVELPDDICPVEE